MDKIKFAGFFVLVAIVVNWFAVFLLERYADAKIPELHAAALKGDKEAMNQLGNLFALKKGVFLDNYHYIKPWIEHRDSVRVKEARQKRRNRERSPF